MDVIRFFCVHCGKKIKVGVHFAGMQGKCPACEFGFTVPSPADQRIPYTEPTGDELPAEVTSDATLSDLASAVAQRSRTHASPVAPSIPRTPPHRTTPPLSTSRPPPVPPNIAHAAAGGHSLPPPIPSAQPASVLEPHLPQQPSAPAAQPPTEVVKLGAIDREVATGILEASCGMQSARDLFQHYVVQMKVSSTETTATERTHRLDGEAQIGNYTMESASVVLARDGFGLFEGCIRAATANGSNWEVMLIFSLRSPNQDYITSGHSQPMFGAGRWQFEIPFSFDHRLYDAVETITVDSTVRWSDIERDARFQNIFAASRR
jgi:hypothetical protein